MGLTELRWMGEKTFRGADEERQASLTVEPGQTVAVSDSCAEKLLKVDGWKKAPSEGSGKKKGKAASAPGAEDHK